MWSAGKRMCSIESFDQVGKYILDTSKFLKTRETRSLKVVLPLRIKCMLYC